MKKFYKFIGEYYYSIIQVVIFLLVCLLTIDNFHQSWIPWIFFGVATAFSILGMKESMLAGEAQTLISIKIHEERAYVFLGNVLSCLLSMYLQEAWWRAGVGTLLAIIAIACVVVLKEVSVD